jgi:tetratricopeptide (TPR) repeat protein
MHSFTSHRPTTPSATDHLARHQFIELEGLCRQTDDPAYLAHVLYWYGSTLQSLGRAQEALTKWNEAASIRRELGHEGHLADCLLVMADTHRRRGQHDHADPLYTEAEEIYARLGAEDVLGSTIYWHGMSLWSGGRPQEALPRVDEALRLAIEDGNDEFECRSRGLRAMVLADLGDLSAASEELDLAESRCNEAGFLNLAVWMLARRAYLYARENREIAAVTQELSKAFVYAVDHDEVDAATSAIRRVSLTHQLPLRRGVPRARPDTQRPAALESGGSHHRHGHARPAAGSGRRRRPRTRSRAVHGT